MLFILFSYTIEQIHISQAGRDMAFVWVRAGCGNLLRTESAYQRLLVLALPDGWMEAVTSKLTFGFAWVGNMHCGLRGTHSLDSK